MASKKTLTLRSITRKAMLVALLPVLLTGLAACSGSDGSNGVNGTNGTNGTNGADAAPAASTALALQPQAQVTVNSITVDTSVPATPTIKTTFTPVKDTMYPGGLEAISSTNATQLAYLRFAYARLKAPAAGSGDSAQWVRYSSGDRTPSHLTDNHNGTFTMATPISALDYDATMPTRLLMMVSAVTNAAAPLNVIQDFVPNGSAATVSRDIVSEDACVSCHGNREGSTNGISGIHGGSRYKLAGCVVCHTDKANSAAAQGVSTGRVIQTLIHQIHSSIDATAIADPARQGSDNWSDVTYPQNIKFCAKCHTAPAVNANNWKNAPTMAACVTCHTTIVFDGATSFVGLDGVTKTHGLVTNNVLCAICHTPSGGALSVANAHDTTPTAANTPEFDVTLAITAPANGSFYTTGDTPTVTATLKDHTTGLDVASSVYTTAADVAGVTGGGLKVASVYIYGPRDESVPVLATNTVSDAAHTYDNVTTFPTQGHNLFTGGTDAQVATDASGFKYNLLGDPGTLPAGTYMVRVRFGDYSRVSDADYKIESTAYTTIQIGTATVEPKVSGDACIDCHGTGTAPFHDARHSVVFNTDECLSCHDKSGNHADYIGNRVHAVHGASITGDLVLTPPANWGDVTFPQPANNCTICHTNASAPTPVWRQPDMLVCGGCHGARATALITSYPGVDQAKFDKEIGAAQHMVQNGGDTNPLTPPTQSCAVCHGAGRTADLFDTHRLITFPPPVSQD